jgi:hypothetical protein
MDAKLNATDRALAEVTMFVAEAINSMPDTNPKAKYAPERGYWTEELIPPMSEDDVLTSALRTAPGHPSPASGFTLWSPDGVAYDVTIELHK